MKGKKEMKKINVSALCVFFLFLLMLVRHAYSEEHSLIYSKEHEVCDSIVNKLNKETSISGFNKKIEYNPLGGIQWSPVDESFRPLFYAVFDINNDGVDELVINNEITIEDKFNSNVIYIFDKSFSVDKKIGVKNLKESIGSIDLNGAIYCVGEENNTLVNKKWKNMCLSGAFGIHPFNFGKSNYILIRDVYSKTKKNIYVISKYRGGHVRMRARKKGEPIINKQAIDDICYIKTP